MVDYIELSNAQVALAAALIVINGIISVVLRLRIEKMLVLASVRTVVQLALVGLVLEWIFHVDRWYVVIAIAAVMTLVAGWTAAARSKRTFPGLRLITTVSVWASSWTLTAYVLFAVFCDLPKWYEPQYAIPLLGMVLGNALNGISVGLSTFTESLVRQRGQVETLIALGATRHEAAAEPMREAVRTGMIPIINSMMVVGLVSLPGMMTGQVISGVDPAQAVRYQIVIMFLIAGATALGTVSVVYLSMLRLFATNHRFRRELIG
ncbi:iron export ABC transporter permease subunit FetB [Stieleria sp. TO1_6]|uniref:ABC transporter permease n=1 Tax=Stieleria tagensis TaxID=2956795 RepID=UPI00209AA5CC|nr:iron export ABC transporter permease subunit FetB [Stieleria tagensis]MCO8122080.1 iron export ABC transporter permease subunit FetB [Stieleria tagensis]